jgi:predicted outer membrane repeat protein
MMLMRLLLFAVAASTAGGNIISRYVAPTSSFRQERRLSEWVAAVSATPSPRQLTVTAMNPDSLNTALASDGVEVLLGGNIIVNSIPQMITIKDRTGVTILGQDRLIKVNVMTRALYVENSVGVYVRSVVLEGGDVDVTTSVLPGEGGGLLVHDSSQVHLVDSTIRDCAALYNGGGVYVKQGSTLCMVRCSLTQNLGMAESSELGGGGLYVDADPNNAVLAAYTTFENNTAAKFGGGLRTQGGTLDLVACLFTFNTAQNFPMSNDVFVYASGDTPPVANFYSSCLRDQYLLSAVPTPLMATCQNCPTPFPAGELCDK